MPVYPRLLVKGRGRVLGAEQPPLDEGPTVINGDYRGQSTIKVRLAISQLPREPTFRSLGYAALIWVIAIKIYIGSSRREYCPWGVFSQSLNQPGRSLSSWECPIGAAFAAFSAHTPTAPRPVRRELVARDPRGRPTTPTPAQRSTRARSTRARSMHSLHGRLMNLAPPARLGLLINY